MVAGFKMDREKRKKMSDYGFSLVINGKIALKNMIPEFSPAAGQIPFNPKAFVRSTINWRRSTL